MDKFELIARTKKFAGRIYFFAEGLPNSRGANNIAHQVHKSSSSVAANYRAACRAKSKADFLNKLKIVEEEADETLFWLEFANDLSIVKDKTELNVLINEADELVAIFTKSLKTLRENSNKIVNQKS